MALFCKENHCGSCEKAFCCFSCRSKHETIVHKKSETESIRKVLAPIRNGIFQSNNTLPKIPEVTQIKNPEDNRTKHSVHIYEDKSLSRLTELIGNDQDEKSREKVKDFTGIVNKLTDEKTSQLEDERCIFSEKTFSISPDGINEEILVQKENVPLIFDHINSFTNIEEPFSLNETSSVYCICSENLTGPGKTPKSTSTTGTDPGTNDVRTISETSSIYFPCSEYSMKESMENRTKPGGGNEGFETFERNSKLASTKLEITVSFSQDTFETAVDTIVESLESTDTECSINTLKEKGGIIEISSTVESLQNDNSSEDTLSAYGTGELSVIFDECSSINLEESARNAEPRRNYLSEFVRAFATQTSAVESGVHSMTDISHDEKIQIIPPVFEHTQSQPPVALPEPTFTVNADTSLWQSFSSSIQRAYNSTKEMCNNIGRKNKSKRELDDVEEEQPGPKRPKISILRRPPLRDSPKVIFKQDGEFRRPVIGFDKGTQTN